MADPRFRNWLGVGVTFAVAVCATTAILSLRNWADYASKSILEITQLQSMMSRLASLEDRATSIGQVDPELKQDLAKTKSQATELITPITAELTTITTDAERDRVRDLPTLYQKYIEGLEQQFALMEQGNFRSNSQISFDS